MMWANVGGIVSTWTFNDPPKYHKPGTVNLVFSISEIKHITHYRSLLMKNYRPLIPNHRISVYIFAAGGNILYLRSENNRRAKEREELAKSGAQPEDEAEKLRLGDRHRDFVYAL